MAYLIEYNSGRYWFEYGTETRKMTAIQLAQDLMAQESEFDWPYRVINEKMEVVWPPEIEQLPLFAEVAA